MGPHEVGEWTKNNHNVSSGQEKLFFKTNFLQTNNWDNGKDKRISKVKQVSFKFLFGKNYRERERERHGLSLMDVKNKASWESFDYNVQIPYLQDVLFKSHKNNYIISLVKNRHSGSRHYFELHLILLCLYSK